uniref:bolA-like protein 1 n=1 Tax=Doryrhamphus excisus TaxID=161450 RepID=UPI0025AE7AF6|nr:bolA-like protein 1 [Doryrhamphus excisus]
MLPAILRCARHVSSSVSLPRPLSHITARMDPQRPVEGAIRAKLTDAFQPTHLEVHNESHMHAVPPGSESHFRVLVVSSRFEGASLLQRHRLVNEALKAELSGCVHALAIQAKTPEQWGSDPALEKSPPCLGGSRGDHTMEEKLKAGR